MESTSLISSARARRNVNSPDLDIVGNLYNLCFSDYGQKSLSFVETILIYRDEPNSRDHNLI